MAYSLDLRGWVVEFVEEGGSRVEAAARFKISLWCVKDWLKRKNSLAPGKPGPQGSWKLNRNTLKIAFERKPDITLDELAQEMGAGRTAIWHALEQMKISRKKTWLYAERDEKMRTEFKQELEPVNPADCVSVDESGLEESLCWEYGRAPRGQKVSGERMGKKAQRFSIIVALNQKKLVAPLHFKGYCDTEIVNSWVENALSPC